MDGGKRYRGDGTSGGYRCLFASDVPLPPGGVPLADQHFFSGAAAADLYHQYFPCINIKACC